MDEYVLDVRDWTRREFSVPVSRLPFTIGRGPENDLVLAEPSVSKQHAHLAREGDGLFVVDKGSLNGVYVNSEKERISGRRFLKPRDVVRICSNRLTVSLPNIPQLPAGPPENGTIVFHRSRDTWDAVKGMRDGLSSVVMGSSARRGGARDRIEETMSRILLEESLPRAFESVLSLAERLVAFDRCLLISFDGAVERSRVLASRIHAGPGADVAVSRGMLERVAREQVAVVFSSEEAVAPTKSIIRSGARYALCVPLISETRVHGVIYLDRQGSGAEALSREDADAIGPLAGLIALKLASFRLEEERKASQRIGKELELARSIQESLLPREPARIRGYSVEGYASPCYEVGGDYFDLIPREDGSLIVAIGDVSGKGLSSALYMACVRSALRAHVEAGLAPGDILRRLSKDARETFRPDHFMTLFLALLDPRAGTLSYGNAGHLPPMGIEPGGRIYELEATDPAINIVDWKDYTICERALEPGEVLLLYTDGLIEAESPQGEPYSMERLRSSFARRSQAPLDRIRREIFDEVEAFSGRAHPQDDRTLVLLRRDAPERSS
jgi:sigma-B regulation protein RsbU (phosphoserine phosphatase)